MSPYTTHASGEVEIIPPQYIKYITTKMVGVCPSHSGPGLPGDRDLCRLHATASRACLLRSLMNLLSSSFPSILSSPKAIKPSLGLRSQCNDETKERRMWRGRRRSLICEEELVPLHPMTWGRLWRRRRSGRPQAGACGRTCKCECENEAEDEDENEDELGITRDVEEATHLRGIQEHLNQF